MRAFSLLLVVIVVCWLLCKLPAVRAMGSGVGKQVNFLLGSCVRQKGES